jgi:ParB-like chromosome segregation protein Spo0J
MRTTRAAGSSGIAATTWVRFAIELGLTEIDVLVKDPDDLDNMRAVSENVVRAASST